jgi:ABC-type Zn uptake system ZnuABC Zn-binding protein ZnuA
VTTHDAFSYFADYFEFEVVAFVAEGPGQEPTPQDVANLARAIEREGVPAVFGEPQIGEETDILEQAADDAGVQVCTLYSDSLDDKVTSYIELMRFNADELARCLGGEG